MSKLKSLAIGTSTAVITLLSVQAAFAYDAFDRRIRVTNNSSVTLTELYGTNKGDGSWGYNLLNYPLRPGRTIIIDLEDYEGYCRYDVMSVFRDGSELYTWDLNACEVMELTYGLQTSIY